MTTQSSAIGYGIWLAWFSLLPALVRPYWETVVKGLGGLDGVVTLGSAAVHLSVLILANSFFAALYWLQSPPVEACKGSPKPWPWVAQRSAHWALVRQGVLRTLFNNLVALALAYTNVPLFKARGLTASVDAWPSTWTLAWQTLFCIAVEDAFFYTTHRTLHAVPFLYKHVHKVHHAWHETLSVAAESTHVVEFVLGNALPVIAGPLLLGRIHAYTLLQWVALRVWETVDGHSGYSLPWVPFRVLPGANTAADHDAHHLTNTGNFGSTLWVWDWVFGTAIIPAQTAPKVAAVNVGAARGGEGGAEMRQKRL